MRLTREEYSKKLDEYNRAVRAGDGPAQQRLASELYWGRQREADNYNERWRGVRRSILDARRCCQKCGSFDRLEVDHIVPESEGGSALDLANLQVLCHSCHKEKTRQELIKRHLDWGF